MRYYLECPHDFYLRKVLGFAPTIDQAFGYGRGVHNLMRSIHSNPKRWAELASDRDALVTAIEEMMSRGLMYLRYTTGDPARNMRAKATRIIADYVQTYASELDTLTFEPEREFETLLPEEDVLVTGAIDVIRLDDPPRVTLIDFKSGDPESDISSKLDSEEMKLQVSLYGLAAKRELEYEPERGLVRYLGAEADEDRELDVPLNDAALAAARDTTLTVARSIRDRRFDVGPQRPPRDDRHYIRCGECDFRLFCGRPEAIAFRGGS
jgi:DNA helicase-2/ATP-dependent DNA helicase PcrA